MNEDKITNIQFEENLSKEDMDKPLHVYDAATVELAKDAKRGINYGRVRRERAIGEAARNRNRSAILAGTCILGAAAAAILSGNNINQVLNDELNAIYSWEALGQYIKDLGPITTLLGGGAGAFIATYFRDSARLRRAQQEFEDFNNSFNSEIDLGGEENDRTR